MQNTKAETECGDGEALGTECSCGQHATGDSRLFANTNAEDDATRKPRRSIFIVVGSEMFVAAIATA